MTRIDFLELKATFKKGEDMFGNVYYESEQYGFRIYKEIDPYKSTPRTIKYKYSIYRKYNGRYQDTYERAETKNWALAHIHTTIELGM